MDRKINLIIKSKNIKGTTFVGVRNYKSSNGEIANHTFVVGADYGKAKECDLEKARNFDLSAVESDFSLDILEQAKSKIVDSLSKPFTQEDNVESPYIKLATGIELHRETGEMYVVGFSMNKTVLTPGEYKKVNSRELTLAKKFLTKQMNLKTSKYRRLKVGYQEDIKISGVTI